MPNGCLCVNTLLNKEVPASKGLAPHTDRIIFEVSRCFKARPSELTAVRLGTEYEPRDYAGKIKVAKRTPNVISASYPFWLKSGKIKFFA